ncbi:S9 family peptidase [Candidatus Neomarinimicrobiota bacterium]
MVSKYYHTYINYIFSFIFILTLFSNILAQEPLSPNDVLQLKSVNNAIISPNGQWVAYTVRVPRTLSDEPGDAYYELHLMSIEDKKPIPYVAGMVNVSNIQWKPDGTQISFIMKRGDGTKSQVWGISINGGEASQITKSPTNVLTYQWLPTENKIAYTATTPKTEKEKMFIEKGYEFIYYEENLKHRNLYLKCLKCDCDEQQLTKNITVWGFKFSPDGKTIAADISPKNLIDHKYMFRKIYLLDIESKELTQISENPGKLGNYAFSPDGSKLAYCASLTREDHQISQAYVMDIDGSNLNNLTPQNFLGHVNWVGWKDNNSIIYLSAEKSWSTLSTVNIVGGKRKIILNSEESGLIFSTPSYAKEFSEIIMTASSAKHPSELISWKPGKSPKILTNSNPLLSERTLGMQLKYKYIARDGHEVEGILIYPVNYKKGQSYPTVVLVHGGPESLVYNGWNTNYSQPGQILAGRGYFVFYPNYRASTGYGLEFALEGLGDPAGVEFEDIADGIDALISDGLADKERIGLGGGSYGGYAAAWFSSYYTEKIKAACMFVGISNLISKRGTTDIPYEELYVHSGKMLEEMWQENLKRSPIYYAHQSKTAVLIMGGTDDTRVHPEQSLEYYRRLKLNNHPAVRLVQYPGEKHGNSKQTSRTDMLYRILDWYDWYVKDSNPLEGSMPSLDISENYGLGLD